MRRPRPSQVLIATGLGILLLGAAVVATPWYQATQWQASPEATVAARNAAAPTPVWITPTPVVAVQARSVAAPKPVATALPNEPSPPIATIPPVLSTPIAVDAQIAPQPTATPATSDLRVGNSAFAFDDPPRPGAHVHLDLTVENPTERESVPVLVDVPTTWLT